MVSNYLSTNIQYLRKQRALSQAALADQLSMTRSKIASYENGNAEPSAVKLLVLARFFQIGIHQLIEADLRLLSRMEKDKGEDNHQEKRPSELEGRNQVIDNFEQKARKMQTIAEGFRAYYELEWCTTNSTSPDVTPLLKSYENVLLVLDSFVRYNDEIIAYLKGSQSKITAQ